MSKKNTIAVVNRSYKHNDKEVMSLGSTSGESSDSDESILLEFDPQLDEGHVKSLMNIMQMMRLIDI